MVASGWGSRRACGSRSRSRRSPRRLSNEIVLRRQVRACSQDRQMIGRDSRRRSRDHHCKDDPCNSFAIARGGIEAKPIPASAVSICYPVSIPSAGGGGLHAAWPTQTMAASGSGFEKWPLPVPPDGASYGWSSSSLIIIIIVIIINSLPKCSTAPAP